MECFHFEEIDSTSTYLKEHFSSFSDFTFVSTDFQTAGRGRSGRTWVGEKGKNLLFSFIVKDKALLPHYKDISISCAYVLAKTIESLYGLEPSIKWPNDVYLGHKKTCGILLESHMDNGEIDGLIIGIGINVNQKLFPEDLLFPVTSLSVERRRDLDIEALKSMLFSRLETYLLSLKDGVKEHIYYARSHNELLGKEVFAQIDKSKKKVSVVGINDDCELLLEVEGIRRSVCSGEITFHI